EIGRCGYGRGATEAVAPARQQADVATEEMEGDVVHVPSLTHRGLVPVVVDQVCEQVGEGLAFRTEEVERRDGRQGHGSSLLEGREGLPADGQACLGWWDRGRTECSCQGHSPYHGVSVPHHRSAQEDPP